MCCGMFIIFKYHAIYMVLQDTSMKIILFLYNFQLTRAYEGAPLARVKI